MSQVLPLRGRVVTEDREIDDGIVIVDGDQLSWVGEAADALAGPLAGTQVAPTDSLILPGLVDIHCHGGGGESFPDATTPDQVVIAAQEHLRHGTTSLVASLVTADPEVLLHRIDTLAEVADAGELAGIHLEGPFLARGRCGAQNPDFMQAPNPALVAEAATRARGHFVTMTIAPEIPGNCGPHSVIDALVEAGAVPSFGHTDCDAPEMESAIAQARAALAEGGRSARPTATHLFNGMRPIHHRDPGPALAALAGAARGDLVVELISDGVHLDPATVREVFDVAGRENIMLITDAMAAAGMPDGEYVLGPVRVRVAGGVARLAEGDSIAGGTAHVLDVVRLAAEAGVPLVDAVYCASAVPATVLGQAGSIGALRAGLAANVVVTDPQLTPRAVMRGGRWVEGV